MFAGKAGDYPRMWISARAYPSVTGDLIANIRLGRKGLPRTNTLDYWAHSKDTKKIKCCEYSPRCRGEICSEFTHYSIKLDCLSKMGKNNVQQ